MMNSLKVFNELQLAEIAYNAYGANRNYRTFDNRIMPMWSELPEEIKIAWVSSVKCILSAINEKEIISNEN